MSYKDILFYFFTKGVDNIYRTKLITNQLLFLFIAFITVSKSAPGNFYRIEDKPSDLEIAYYFISIFIVILLVLENNLRKNSSYYRMIQAIVLPYNGNTGMNVSFPYNRIYHIRSLLQFLIIDVLKTLSGCYCVIALVLKSGNIWVDCIIFGILFTECLLGIFIYFLFIICIILNKKFIVKWLRWMCKYYHCVTANYYVKLENGVLNLNIESLNKTNKNINNTIY